MPDVSLTTGGQRQSRSRRSNTPRFDTGDVSVRSRDFARTVSVVQPASLEGLDKAVSSFFPALAGITALEQERQLDEIRKQNAEAVASMEAAVRQDREGAREAIRTGDFSKFIPDSELRRRRVITTAFKQLVGRLSAHEDAPTLRDRIMSADGAADPRDVVESFLQENLKGADPLFAREYSEELDRLAAKPITELRAARVELAQTRAERSALQLIRSQLAEGEFPPTSDGLAVMRSQMVGALPVSGPEAVMRTDDLIDGLLINLAASGDARALHLAQLPDPARDGTSVLSRHPGKMEEAVASFVKRKNQVRSIEANAELESFEDRLALIEAGEDIEGDSLESLWSDLWTHRERHGDSGRWDALRDKIAAKIGEKGIERGNIRRIARGLLPNVSDSKWSDVAAKLQGDGVEALMREGLTEQAARNRVFQVLGNRGSGKKVRDMHSARLMGSSNAQEVLETFSTLVALDRASDRPMEGNHLSESAANLYRLMLWAKTSGRDPLAVRATYLEALNASEGQGDPKTHFERRLVDPGSGRNSTTQGRAGVSEQAKRLWSELDRVDLEVDSGLFGSGKPSYEDLPAVVQARLESAINTASFMLSTQSVSTDEIRSLAGDMVKGQFGLELGPDGEPSIVLDQTPPVAIGDDGIPVAGSRVTMEVLERAKATLETPEAERLGVAIGGYGGLAQDSLTRSGGGLAVRSIASGFSQDILLTPGSRFSVPLSELPEDLPLAKFLEELARDKSGDAVTFAVPTAPAQGAARRVYLTESEPGSGRGDLFMLYDDRRGMWTLRYQDRGPRRMSLEELNAENKAARRQPLNTPVEEMSDERLRRRAAAMKVGAAEELGKRRAPVGSPVPGPDDRGALTEDEVTGARESESEALMEFVSRGIVTPAAALAVDDAGDVTSKTEAAFRASRQGGAFLDDVTKPISRRFLHEVTDFLTDVEGRSSFVYDDATGRRLRPGQRAKGNPTVATGFNLNRPDAKELIEKVGADYAAVKEGRSPLTRAQQDKLTALVVRQTVNFVREKFKGVDLPNHRLMALVSLAYNSPSLIGPVLTKAIKEGRWRDAAAEIEFNSAGNVPKHLIRGVMSRRAREAAIFRGTLQ